ncbi:serine/threonine-protein phosphatase pp2a-related [Anaeramoeba flamelloides]|uniref:protein-serine/threonine phosphatase n=1 Tax=Anaeramoeba flamelloides TaxID=1746091 RepID=A0AAV8A7D0_9EUKA|nr:serine/threonine-protein phosphatase pp2a-related [Anaeramoeba flamelloides]
MDYNKLLSNLAKKNKLPKENKVIEILERVQEILFQENTILYLDSKINVVGDTHGQFFDVLEILSSFPKEKYLFMGDYVDRGGWSVHLILYLFLLKLRNHESRDVSKEKQQNSFYMKCLEAYDSPYVWRQFMVVFDYLPLCATIDNKFFCVHAGLSPEVTTLSQINWLDRFQEPGIKGAISDLVWSDPSNETTDFTVSIRGSGFLFGKNPTERFLHKNNLDVIFRSHFTEPEGHKWWFKNESKKKSYEGLLCTIWTAPNYNYKVKNKGHYLKIKENDQQLDRWIIVEKSKRDPFHNNQY